MYSTILPDLSYLSLFVQISLGFSPGQVKYLAFRAVQPIARAYLKSHAGNVVLSERIWLSIYWILVSGAEDTQVSYYRAVHVVQKEISKDQRYCVDLLYTLYSVVTPRIISLSGIHHFSENMCRTSCFPCFYEVHSDGDRFDAVREGGDHCNTVTG